MANELAQKAAAAWGEPLPDWLAALVAACEAASMTAVARRLGRSVAAISQVISNSYAGRTDRIASDVRAVLMTDAVACPVLGAIDGARCHAERHREFSCANPQLVRLARTCPTCAQNPEVTS
jgi:hypothetical protein